MKSKILHKLLEFIPPQTETQKRSKKTNSFTYFTWILSLCLKIDASPRELQIRLIYYAYACACAVLRKQNEIIADLTRVQTNNPSRKNKHYEFTIHLTADRYL
jgi:hypothetical protein